MTTACPLQWPAGRPRRTPIDRTRAKFGTTRTNRGWSEKVALTVADALERLQRELDMIGGRYPVVSSNVETRLDGRPRSGQREPEDPGVAVYFHLAGKPHCLPCDRYDRVADNIAAVAAHIEATRAIERHGVADVGEMFAGFVALPQPKTWWQVLGVPEGAALAEAEAAFRRLAKIHHPDAGGSAAAFAELSKAIQEARKHG